MNQSEQLNELATALAKAQAEIGNAEEDKSNPHFKSKYATLASIWDACRGPLTKYGLSISQMATVEDGKPVFVTLLMHSSGQWIRSTFPITPTVKVQETGSQITYLRRYFLSSIAGVAPGEVLDDDDDGEVAMGRKPVKTTYQSDSHNDTPMPPQPPIASKDDVDTLMSLVNKCPKEKQENFAKIIVDKYEGDKYKMGKKFCETQTQGALKFLGEQAC